MAIQYRADQQLYKGRGPLDSKALVKTYADLLNLETWTEEGTLIAYNGMIVAVWLDKVDANNNGIYYLYDTTVTTAIKKPDPTIADNWHKISGDVDLSGIQSLIEDLTDRVDALEQEDKLHTYGYRKDFPQAGKDGHMYVAIDEKKTYVWANNEYIPVGGSEYEEPTVIYGGSAN